MSTLSVVLITLNEELNIVPCLESVLDIASEIIVIDSGSEDRTAELAKSLGAKVIDHPWEGSFTAQKNFALSRATKDWILCLDADECLSDELRSEISDLISEPKQDSSSVDGYKINRRTSFLGQFMHCWSPDWILRLVRQGKSKYEGGLVHEKLVLADPSKISTLTGCLNHYSYKSIEDYVERLNRYTTLAAKTMSEEGKPFRVYKLLLSPLSMTLRMYFFKGGWRDGIRGIFLCLASGFYGLVKYAKLFALEKNKE